MSDPLHRPDPPPIDRSGVPEPTGVPENTGMPEPGQGAEPGRGVEHGQVPAPHGPRPAPGSPAARRGPATAPEGTPLYKGEPLDAERGPGLGCFWIQVIALGVLLVLTPLTVVWAWDERISAALLIVTLLLLLFAGQTVIFLLRLVAMDRRGRRRPLDETARKTVGQLEDEVAPPRPPSDEPPAADR